MQVIKANCPLCGSVELLGRDIKVDRWPTMESLSRYSFTCPKCGDRVDKPAPQATLSALADANGVLWVSHVTPHEPKPDVPPLTLDDVDDYVIELGLASSEDIFKILEEGREQR